MFIGRRSGQEREVFGFFGRGILAVAGFQGGAYVIA